MRGQNNNTLGNFSRLLILKNLNKLEMSKFKVATQHAKRMIANNSKITTINKL